MRILFGLLVVCVRFQGIIAINVISQWASIVRNFSTQWAANLGSYSANDILGPPNCYPIYTGAAWSPTSITPASEFIEFEVNQTVCVNSVETYETANSGFVTQFLAMMPDGSWDILYSGGHAPFAGSRIFIPSLPQTNHATKIFRLNMDFSSMPGWIGLDAVRVNGTSTSGSPVCVFALYTNTSLSVNQNLCSSNNSHQATLDGYGGIVIDGQQWLSGNSSATSPMMNYTNKNQLIIVVNGNSILWQLDLPNNPDNGLPGNVTMTNDGILQMVNARGIPIWNHKQGYLLPRLITAYGPHWLSASLLEDHNNATCIPNTGLIIFRIAPIPRNAMILASIVGINLSCTTQLQWIIPGTIDPPAAGPVCSFVSKNGTTTCTFSCTCAIDQCVTVGLVTLGCADAMICEAMLP